MLKREICLLRAGLHPSGVMFDEEALRRCAPPSGMPVENWDPNDDPYAAAPGAVPPFAGVVLSSTVREGALFVTIEWGGPAEPRANWIVPDILMGIDKRPARTLAIRTTGEPIVPAMGLIREENEPYASKSAV